MKANLDTFLKRVGINVDWSAGLITAHGDKCYGYKWRWEEENIPFEHGVAIYLLTYFKEYDIREQYERSGKWIDPGQWVIDNYARFRPYLPEATST